MKLKFTVNEVRDMSSDELREFHRDMGYDEDEDDSLDNKTDEELVALIGSDAETLYYDRDAGDQCIEVALVADEEFDEFDASGDNSDD